LDPPIKHFGNPIPRSQFCNLDPSSTAEIMDMIIAVMQFNRAL